MMDSARKNIDREISDCKQKVALNESMIFSQLTKMSTPGKETPRVWGPQQESANCLGRSRTGSDSPSLHKLGKSSDELQNSDNRDVMSYLSNIKQLQSRLEEKNYMVEIAQQKQKINYENDIRRLTKQLQMVENDLSKKQLTLQSKEGTIQMLQNQISQLDKTLKQKQSDLARLNEELSHFRRVNTQIKMQNKKYKADNKVIMGHIDRITHKQPSQKEKQQAFNQRELRVMRSLYQETLPTIEEKQTRRQQQMINDLTNKILLDDAVDRNSDLKSLLRRLNEQIQVLKKEKLVLTEENKQKVLLYENQKRLTAIAEESNEKLRQLIGKMSQKTMSLEQINQTLRQTLRKHEDGEEASDDTDYRSQRTRAGRFYYKR